MEVIHRRAQIINALERRFVENLTLPQPGEVRPTPQALGFPMAVKTVQKRFAQWTALDKQNALPALLLTYGDNGSAPDSEVVGYIDENFPILVTAVLKEAPPPGKELTDQASDIHYAIGRLINKDRTLGVEGVNPEKTRIVSWRSSEGTIPKFEIIRFSVLVVHRYHASEDV